jgi:hypothetical protein
MLKRAFVTRHPAGYGKLTGNRKSLRFVMRLILSSRYVDGRGAMLTREDYRQLAERCALLAGECGAPGIAEALRALALDYLARAASQKQQQTHSLSR